MLRPDIGTLRAIHIEPDVFSRGTGATVDLQEAVVYDFMLPILGNRFRVDDALKRATHYFSGSGSFMMNEQAYGELATEELSEGNLVSALEAYKRGLHSAVGFAGAMAMLGERALLSPAEIERFHLSERFGPLERRLTTAVIAAGGDTKIELPEYAVWVAGVRTLERDAIRLNRQFFIGVAKHPDNPEIKWTDPDYWDKSLVGDRKIGGRLRDTYAEMQRYKDATWVSKEMGDEDGVEKYTELAKTDPEENPKFRPIFWKIQEAYER